MRIEKLIEDIKLNQDICINTDDTQIKEVIKGVCIEIALRPYLGDMMIEKGMEYIIASNNGERI